MSRLNVVSEGRALETLALLRNPHTDLDWAFFTYEGKDTIKLLDNGVGGLEQLAGVVRPSMGGFGLARSKEDGVWRYAYITWMGDSLPSMRKAEVAKNMGSVANFFGSYDLDMLVSSTKELTSANLSSKIREALLEAQEEANAPPPATAPRPDIIDEETYIDTAEIARRMGLTQGEGEGTYESLDSFQPYNYNSSDLYADPQDFQGGNTDLYMDPQDIARQMGYDGNVDLYNDPQDVGAAQHGYDDNVELYEAPQQDSNTEQAQVLTEQYRQYLALLSAVSPDALQAIYGTAAKPASDNNQSSGTMQYQQLLELMQQAQQTQQISTIEQQVAAASANSGNSSKNSSKSGLGNFGSIRNRPTSIIQSTNVSGEGQKVDIIDEETAAAKIHDIRDDNSPIAWVLFGYDGISVNKLKLLASGSNVEEIASHVNSDIVAYAMVRVLDRSEALPASRYVFITWMGESVPGAKKAKVAVNKSSILNFLGHYNVDMLVSEKSELTLKNLEAKVAGTSRGGGGVSSSSKSKSAIPSAATAAAASTSPAAAAAAAAAATSKTQSSVPASNTAPATTSAVKTQAAAAAVARPRSTVSGEGKQVQVADAESAKRALGEIRAVNSTIDWLLFGYESKSVDIIRLLGKGSGGVEEMAKILNADMVGYGLIRVRAEGKELAASRYAYITWMGDNIPSAKKAKVAVNKSSISRVLGHYNLDLLVSDKSELTTANLISKFQQTAAPLGASGARQQLANKSAASQAAGGASKSSTTSPAATNAAKTSSVAAPKTGGFVANNPFMPKKAPITTISHVNFSDVEFLKQEIAEVRSDSKPKNWTLFKFDEKQNAIVHLGSGEGGYKQARANLKDDMAAYGFIRHNISAKTVKFIFLVLVGEKLSQLIRGKVPTFRGAVCTLVDPFHVELTARAVSDLTDEALEEKLK